MSQSLRARGIDAVLLDIEGTTTPITFVTEVLFPFARRHLRAWLTDHLEAPHLQEPLARLQDEWQRDAAAGHAPPPWPDAEADRPARIAAIVGYAEWLMDRDRKASGLKALQGFIWQRGYADGALHGDVYPDVPEALQRWHADGLTLAIFSSGSVLAQRDLFRTTTFGDLTGFFSGFFDTTTGPKIEPDSYRRIAATLRVAPAHLLFISDMQAEVDAARAAGCQALLCVRSAGHRLPISV